MPKIPPKPSPIAQTGDWIPVLVNGKKAWRNFTNGKLLFQPKCVACGGTGKNSKGGSCWPCDGTGEWV